MSFFVHHIDTHVIAQRKCIQNWRFQTHLLCSCLNINQSAGNISKDNSNRKKNVPIYSLFKTRLVSREMQHERVTSEHINSWEVKIELELVVEMEVAFEEEVAIGDVIGRRDEACSRALWTA